jgi:Mn-dependent DtxR family transcriptional regulator
MYQDEQLNNLKTTGETTFRYAKEILAFLRKLKMTNAEEKSVTLPADVSNNDVFTGNALDDMEYIRNNGTDISAINAISSPELKNTVLENLKTAQEYGMLDVSLNGNITLTEKGVEAVKMREEGLLSANGDNEIIAAAEQQGTLVVDAIEQPHIFTGDLWNDLEYFRNNVLTTEMLDNIAPPDLQKLVKRNIEEFLEEGSITPNKDGGYTLTAQGRELLDNPNVQESIKEEQMNVRSNTEIETRGVELNGLETDFNYFRYSDSMNFKEIQATAEKYRYNPELVGKIGKNLENWKERGLLSKSPDGAYKITAEGKKALNGFNYAQSARKVTEKAISAGKATEALAKGGELAAQGGSAVAGAAGVIIVVTKKIAKAVVAATEAVNKVNTAYNAADKAVQTLQK